MFIMEKLSNFHYKKESVAKFVMAKEVKMSKYVLIVKDRVIK